LRLKNKKFLIKFLLKQTAAGIGSSTWEPKVSIWPQTTLISGCSNCGYLFSCLEYLMRRHCFFWVAI